VVLGPFFERQNDAEHAVAPSLAVAAVRTADDPDGRRIPPSVDATRLTMWADTKRGKLSAAGFFIPRMCALPARSGTLRVCRVLPARSVDRSEYEEEVSDCRRGDLHHPLGIAIPTCTGPR